MMMRKDAVLREGERTVREEDEVHEEKQEDVGSNGDE